MLPLQEDPVAHLFLKKMVQFEALVERQLTKTTEGKSSGGGASWGSGSNNKSEGKGKDQEDEVMDVSLWEEDEQSSGNGGGASGGSGGRRQSLACALVAQLTGGGQGGVKGIESFLLYLLPDCLTVLTLVTYTNAFSLSYSLIHCLPSFLTHPLNTKVALALVWMHGSLAIDRALPWLIC